MTKNTHFLMLLGQLLAVYVADSQLAGPQGPFAKTAKVGETVKLECQLSFPVVLVTSYFWYKQTVGEAPVAIDTTNCKESDCKFISKKGDSERVLQLEIRDVQVNDSGTYYCADRDGYAPLQPGPKLLVGDSSTDKTSVLVFLPPSVSAQMDPVPLVCLVSGVSSNEIVIFWNISGEVTQGASDVGKRERDGTWNITSQVTVMREQWTSGALCSCVVQLGEKVLTKSVSFTEPAAAKAVLSPEWCNTVSNVLRIISAILLLSLILIMVYKDSRSAPGRRPHNENFRLRERTQRGE
ncbi:uncharacterized protein LOC122541995 [Chiloscyllium plagiosum]|uniref:uncharacterized protein LOC122541995 n=1 Tax=Chiloscyllium plagiosum TaxID=36176 RepID=UPI001CB80453|nr:uncharacterized protein LOC122541995 [Chiloscyllium plagiosum]